MKEYALTVAPEVYFKYITAGKPEYTGDLNVAWRSQDYDQAVAVADRLQDEYNIRHILIAEVVM